MNLLQMIVTLTIIKPINHAYGPALSSEPDRELHHVCLPTGSHAMMQQREISRKQC